VEAGLRHGLLMLDPLGRGTDFLLRFRNAEQVAVIPVAAPEEAAERLRAAGLASFGDWAGPGLLTLTLAFAGLPPRIAETRDLPVAMEILAARVAAASGAVLHDFAAAGSLGAAIAARAASPELGAAAIGGLHIGMASAEAWAAAVREHPEAVAGAFYAGLPEHARRFGVTPRCDAGLVADIRAFGLRPAPQNAYAACLAPLLASGEDPLAGRVAEITALRFLPDLTPEELRFDLQDRHGRPLEEPREGLMVWVGRDPAPGGWPGLLELRAEFARMAPGDPRGERGTLLALTLRRHVPPDDSGS
jgi:hypothetical protein